MNRSFYAMPLVSLLACTAVPHEIRVAKARFTVYDKSPIVLDAAVVDKDGQPVVGVALTFTPVPADIVSVNAAGTAQCLQSGEAAVSIGGAGLNGSATIRCRIVAKIDVPSGLRFVLGEDATAIPVEVTADNGSKIENAPVRVASTDTSVIDLNGTRPMPNAVGHAKLRFTLGDASEELPIDVVQRVRTEALALSDGESQVITLRKGSYEVDIAATASGGHGVTAQWIGAPCESAHEAQQHTLRCTVPDTGTLRIENPTMFGMGGTAAGHLNVFRVPG